MSTITPTGPHTESIEVVPVPPAPRTVSLADRIRMRAGLALLLADAGRGARRGARRTAPSRRVVQPGHPAIEVARPFC